MSPEKLLQEATAAPAVAALGTVERAYVSRPRWVRTLFGPVLSDGVLAGAWASLALTLLFGTLAFYQRAKSSPQVRLVNFGVTLFVACLGGGLFAIRHGQQPGRFAYLIYPTGLAYFEDDHWTAVRWDETGEILSPPDGGGDATLVTLDGRRVPLRSAVVDRLAYQARVEKEVVERVYRRARQALAAGQTVTFGPLAIGPDGLIHDGQTLPWQELERLAVSRSMPDEMSGMPIRFDRAGRRLWVIQAGGRWWCDVRSRDIPTRTVLVQLIRARCPGVFDDISLAHFDDAP